MIDDDDPRAGLGDALGFLDELYGSLTTLITWLMKTWSNVSSANGSCKRVGLEDDGAVESALADFLARLAEHPRRLRQASHCQQLRQCEDCKDAIAKSQSSLCQK